MTRFVLVAVIACGFLTGTPRAQAQKPAARQPNVVRLDQRVAPQHRPQAHAAGAGDIVPWPVAHEHRVASVLDLQLAERGLARAGVGLLELELAGVQAHVDERAEAVPFEEVLVERAGPVGVREQAGAQAA